jgi:hypothetical protein
LTSLLFPDRSQCLFPLRLRLRPSHPGSRRKLGPHRWTAATIPSFSRKQRNPYSLSGARKMATSE